MYAPWVLPVKFGDYNLAGRATKPSTSRQSVMELSAVAGGDLNSEVGALSVRERCASGVFSVQGESSFEEQRWNFESQQQRLQGISEGHDGRVPGEVGGRAHPSSFRPSSSGSQQLRIDFGGDGTRGSKRKKANSNKSLISTSSHRSQFRRVTEAEEAQGVKVKALRKNIRAIQNEAMRRDMEFEKRFLPIQSEIEQEKLTLSLFDENMPDYTAKQHMIRTLEGDLSLLGKELNILTHESQAEIEDLEAEIELAAMAHRSEVARIEEEEEENNSQRLSDSSDNESDKGETIQPVVDWVNLAKGSEVINESFNPLIYSNTTVEPKVIKDNTVPVNYGVTGQSQGAAQPFITSSFGQVQDTTVVKQSTSNPFIHSTAEVHEAVNLEDEIKKLEMEVDGRIQAIKDEQRAKLEAMEKEKAARSLERREMSIPRVSLGNCDPITQALLLQFQALGKILENQNGSGVSEKFLARQSHAKELPIFTGRPEEWPSFISDFNRTTDICGYSEAENMSRLRKCLKGEAFTAVQCLMIAPSNLPKVMDILKMRFGNPDHIIQAMVLKAQKVGPVREDKLETLITFGQAVLNLTTTVNALNCLAHLSNPMLMLELESKLPSSYRIQWCEWVDQIPGREQNLEYFTRWVESKIRVVCRICPPKAVDRTDNKDGFKQKPENQSPHMFFPRRREGVNALEDEEDKPSREIKVCHACDKTGHWITQCFQIRKLPVKDLEALVKKKRLCYGCLEQGHGLNKCPKERICGIEGCKGKHNRMLHTPWKPREKPERQHHQHPKEEEETNTVQINTISGQGTIMGVVPLTIKGPKGEESIYAFVDSGSSASLIEDGLAKKLGLDGKLSPFSIGTITASKMQPNSRRVDFGVKRVKSDAKAYQLAGARTVDSLPLTSYSQDMKSLTRRWPHLRNVPLWSFRNVKPQLLIGNSHCYLTSALQHVGNKSDEPIAFKSRIGWTLGGPQVGSNADSRSGKERVYHIMDHDETNRDEDLHQLVKRSFSTEDFGVKVVHEASRSKEDERAMKIMVGTTKRVDGGRYETGLLWKSSNPQLPESKYNAHSRLKTQERKMDKDPEFAKSYCDKIQEYLTKGFIRKIERNSGKEKQDSGKEWYLPHFGVINPNKPGKLRLVFDAAAQSHGVSLNSQLMQGPDLNNPLVSVLRKFRQYRVAFAGDVKDMFHRVFIREEDRPALKFLWRGMEREKPPEEYEMLVMVFGAACSPSSAQFVKNLVAEENKLLYPEAYDAITTKFYVDDFLDSTPEEDPAKQLISEVREVMGRGGFELCNFVGNSREVLATVPEELRANDLKNLDFEKGELPVGRMLGLWWNPSLDTFTFLLNFHKVPKDIVDGSRRPTKREVLKLVMSVFDPLGFLGHLVIKAKILLQDVWRCGIGWDDELKDEQHGNWQSWLEELRAITSVNLPRCYSPNIPNANNIQLHLFGDSSEKAFATVAYLRTESAKGIDVSFVTARTRVAPLKVLSIPRLELQAAVMASRLAHSIKQELEFKINETFYWTDSRTVLCWIRNDARRFKQFVSHRIGEILETSDVEEWRWVPTKLNVADDATRDNLPADLGISSRWFMGESFLKQSREVWPVEKEPDHAVPKDELEEKVEVLVITEAEIYPDITRFSSLTRLIRSTAWMNRFIRNLKNKRKFQKGQQQEELSVTELRTAEEMWWKHAQRECYSSEVAELKGGKPVSRKSRILNLAPHLDNNGVLRVRGRLQKAFGLSEEAKHPVILPPKHPFTKLLVGFYHRLSGHQGQATVTNNLRLKYWIVDITAAVKRSAYDCQQCKLKKVKPDVPEMGDLPRYRTISRIRPFTNTGLDYFGPMTVTIGRRKEKRWGVIFTCLSTRAVHLELAGSLSTDSAIMAIRRMSNRRGYPQHIYSDNGTNFVGANNELLKSIEQINHREIKQRLAIRGVEWHFIPPAAPHMGGAWERLVGSVKRTLSGILFEREPKEEMLYTLFTEVEDILNNRPLTHVSVDPLDPTSLTPNHFLTGWSNGAAGCHGPEGNETLKEEKPANTAFGVFDDNDLLLRKQWRASQRLADHFWTRWIREYLPELTRRSKWNRPTNPIKVGDVVIVVDDQAVRSSWPRGIITAVYPGRDRKIRVVDVRTVGGSFRRPVSKICILDLCAPQAVV